MITRCGVQILDFEFQAEIPKGDSVKLRTIVGHDCLRDPKVANDVLPHKLGDIFVLDASIRLYFYPFTEVVYGNEQEFLLSGCGW